MNGRRVLVDLDNDNSSLMIGENEYDDSILEIFAGNGCENGVAYLTATEIAQVRDNLTEWLETKYCRVCGPGYYPPDCECI